ncbi:MAG: hypothetical protein DWI07_00760 [Planctomycetota bacterium]|nr:MAG: hypothetical protein DWI07_00760 [Planctomycetota bacterium]
MQNTQTSHPKPSEMLPSPIPLSLLDGKTTVVHWENTDCPTIEVTTVRNLLAKFPKTLAVLARHPG